MLVVELRQVLADVGEAAAPGAERQQFGGEAAVSVQLHADVQVAAVQTCAATAPALDQGGEEAGPMGKPTQQTPGVARHFRSFEVPNQPRLAGVVGLIVHLHRCTIVGRGASQIDLQGAQIVVYRTVFGVAVAGEVAGYIGHLALRAPATGPAEAQAALFEGGQGQRGLEAAAAAVALPDDAGGGQLAQVMRLPEIGVGRGNAVGRGR